MRTEFRHCCCQFCHLLGMRPETNPWWREHEDIISWAAWWIKIIVMPRASAQKENPSLFSIQYVWVKKMTLFGFFLLHVPLPPSPFSVSCPHSLWRLVGRTVLSWLYRQRVLICSGDTAPFDISPKNRLLWWFPFSLRAFSYSVQFTVWKRPRGERVIVFLTSSIQFAAATCHTLLHDSLRSHGRTHTPTVLALIQMRRFTHSSTHPHTSMHQIREIGVILWLLRHPWVCEDESLRGYECEWNVRLQGPLFSGEEDRRIKPSASVCTPPTQKDTGGCTMKDCCILIFSLSVPDNPALFIFETCHCMWLWWFFF